jgi:glutathione synthase/RimK-type ligase-like ATP-grasp enzyme
MCIERTSSDESHLNNTSQGGTAQLLPLEQVDSEILEMAIKACRVNKLQVAGVDVITNKNNGEFYILEVNIAPQVSSGSFISEKSEKYAKMLQELLYEK